jgi:DNA-binding winged helix-turn-helix (wHTH) protein/tetratricopeptide (TPR) repeat protein
MRAASYRFHDFRLSPAAHELWCGDERLVLPPRVLACLCHLIEQRERAVGRDELIRAVWHRDNVSDIQLGQLILRARRAVGDEGTLQHSIRTVVGFGYRWVAPTEIEVAVPEELPAAADRDDERGTVVWTQDRPASMAGPLPRDIQRAPSIDTAAAASRRPRRKGLALAALAALCIAGLLLFGDFHSTKQETFVAATDARIAVLPLVIDAADENAWLRLGGMDLVAERLRRGGLAVARSETTLNGLGADARVDAAAALERLQRIGETRLLVDGELAGSGRSADGWTARLRARTADGVVAGAEAKSGEAVAALREVSDRLLAALGRAPPSGDTGLATEYVQRARAALLADEPAHAREILETAPAALREDGELRFYLAQSLARGGQFAPADSALTALLGDVSIADDPRLRLRILAARGLARVRIGRLQDARADFATAIAQPHAQDFPAELGEAYNGRAIAAIALHDFDDGSADLGRARLQLERAGDALGVAHVDANLGLLEYERGALAQANAHLASAAQRFEAFSSARERVSALSGLLLVQQAQLQNTAALATSARLWAGVEQAGDPVQKRALVLRRARALFATGSLRESGRLLDAISADPGPNLHDTRDDERLQLLRTELALREGRRADAAREASTLPRALPATGDDDLRALSALVRARALPNEALQPDEVAQLALAAPSPAALPLRALLAAERAQRAGGLEKAQPSFRQALSLAESGGIPFVIATVAGSYASVLLDRGSLDEAAPLIGRISVWAGDDFECALLQLRLAVADGDAPARSKAYGTAVRIAGERAIPAELARPPSPKAR